MPENFLTTVAGVAAELLVEPVADVISDYVIHRVIGAVLVRDVPHMEELHRIQVLQEEVELRDVEIESIYQKKLVEA